MKERAPLPDRARTGFSALLDAKILEATARRVKVSMEVTDRVRQSLGVVHGGALVTLADIAATYGAYVAGREGFDQVTTGMTVHFLRGVREGTLVAVARPLRVGKRTSVWEVRIDEEKAGEGEEPVCFVTANFAARERSVRDSEC
ncbi:MAG: PaaI family thioesterase [Planctomycetes bacterium]|nr:PaaI family thioesterase [Planctomycetota bacterium]